MQIFRTLAGYSLGRADIVRRAMSKKKHDVMEKEREIFINGYVNDKGEIEVEGCLRRGVDRATAISVFSEMESFASYAFNKSHAAAYATIAYQTAWLKCHYPREYLASLMSSVLDSQNKLVLYISECHRFGIMVLPPSVNESYYDFTVVGNNIRYGLSAIKNIGVNLIHSIVENRLEKKYKSFYDFCKRNYGKGLNSKSLESLIKCGALDNLDCNRRQMLSAMKTVMDNAEYEFRNNVNGQLSFFDIQPQIDTSEVTIPKLDDFTVEEKLRMEKEIAGIYFSGHPISKYRAYINVVKADLICDILNDSDIKKYKDGQNVRVICIVSKEKKQLTKSNQMMSFITVEDETGAAEIIAFPKVLAQYRALIEVGKVLEIFGCVSFKEDEEPKIICNSIKIPKQIEDKKGFDLSGESLVYKNKNDAVADETALFNKSGVKLYLKIDNLESPLYTKCRRVLEIFDGSTPVVFYLSDNKKQLIAPKTLWVDLNCVMLKELRHQIGEENVKIK